LMNQFSDQKDQLNAIKDDEKKKWKK
jgi:hypothetical protein